MHLCKQWGLLALEHLHRVKGTWHQVPSMRPWRNTCPTPLHKRGLDCQGSSNFPFHSLSLRVSIAPYCAHIPGSFWPHPLVLRLTWNILDTFSTWRTRKQVTVGECRVKKFGCIGAFQRPFREHAFMPKDRDALTAYHGRSSSHYLI